LTSGRVSENNSAVSDRSKDSSVSPVRVEMSSELGSVVPLTEAERRDLLRSIDRQIAAIEQAWQREQSTS